MIENIYCIEFLVQNGDRCRFTVTKSFYEELSQIADEKEKLKRIEDYWGGKLDIIKLLRQFVTTNQEIMIGNLNGTEMDF